MTGRPSMGDPFYDDVVRRTKQQDTAKDIAAAWGCSTMSVVRYRRRARDAGDLPPLAAHLTNVELSDDELEWAQRLFDDGVHVTEVAATIGRSNRALRHHFPDVPALSHEERTMLGHAVKKFNRLPDRLVKQEERR